MVRYLLRTYAAAPSGIYQNLRFRVLDKIGGHRHPYPILLGHTDSSHFQHPGIVSVKREVGGGMDAPTVQYVYLI